MGQTYYITDALNFIQRNISRNIEAGSATFIVNMAVNEIWMKYDWKESMAQLAPFYLIPNEQDYGAPQYAIPTDFHGLRKAYFLYVASSPATRYELSVIRDIRLTHSRALPHAIGYDTSIKKLRVYPRPPENMSSTDYIVEGDYKRKPTLITSASLQTSLIPWDDIYFQTFTDALLWAAYRATGDPRAGGVQLQNGQKLYTGQMAIMYASIDEMASNEGLNLGDPQIAPREPLVGRWGFGVPSVGIYGL